MPIGCNSPRASIPKSVCSPANATAPRTSGADREHHTNPLPALREPAGEANRAKQAQKRHAIQFQGVAQR